MIKVTESLYRGPRPKDLRDLIALGFQRVIDLQTGAEDFFTDSLYEAQLAAKRADPSLYSEIEVVYLHCSDIFPPTHAHVEAFLLLTSNGKKTLVHCHSGVDRTGFLCAVYRMAKLGWPYSVAYKEWVNLGRHFWYDWWKYTLKAYEGKR